MAKTAAFIGKSEGFNYVVKVNGIDNSFPTKIFGHTLEDRRKLAEWKKDAMTHWVGAKHKATLAAVKKWIKEAQPSEYYTSWRMDSPFYKDDCVEVFYKK